jgi:hypothetical protein
MKKCIECKLPKVLDKFHTNKGNSDGKNSRCKLCIKAQNAKAYAKEKKKNGWSDAKGRIAKTYPYKDGKITIKQALALPECAFSRAALENRLNSGLTLDEIFVPPTKEEKEAAQKLTKIEAAKQRALDRQAIKDAKSEVKRQRALKIMSVPVNVKKTSEYYVMKAYKHRSGSNMDQPIQLTQGGGY